MAHKAHNSIKSTLPRMALVMVVVLIVLITPVNVIVQLYMQHGAQAENAEELFAQMQQLIEQNASDLAQAKEDFAANCIQSAEMAAYFIEHDPKTLQSLEHTRTLADKLDVDELHYFTPDGTLSFGSHPQYYGLSFESGEQMSFFLPMLQDRELRMCQEITPNTAEGKDMQYAAVWLSDGSGIIQIGMEPRRLVQALSSRSLSQLISTLPLDIQGYFHIVDRDTLEIVASTAKTLVGLNLTGEMGEDVTSHPDGSFHSAHGGRRFCVYTQTYRDWIFIRTYASQGPLQEMATSSLLVIVYLVLVSTLVVGLITWYADRKLARNLLRIVEDLRGIEDGQMTALDLQTGIAEFDELIFYINQMMNSIQHNWKKLSYIIDRGHLPIGVYEYNSFYKRTFFNDRLLTILGIEETPDTLSHEALARLVQARLDQIQHHPAGTEPGVFVYDKNQSGQNSYYRIDKVQDKQSVTYCVTDVTLWWGEIDLLREQSNRDSLTGLYNRRGFSEQLDLLFSAPDKVGWGAMVIVDADDLKKINDRYGHYVGDEYLIRIAEALRQAAGPDAYCSRLGGDEFAVFLHHCGSRAEAEQLILRLNDVRGGRFVSENASMECKLEFSLGCSFYPSDGQDYHHLMHIADENMYREKRIRKGRCGAR